MAKIVNANVAQLGAIERLLPEVLQVDQMALAALAEEHEAAAGQPWQATQHVTGRIAQQHVATDVLPDALSRGKWMTR